MFLQKLLTGLETPQSKSQPQFQQVAPVAPVVGKFKSKNSNPFMAALDHESPQFMEMYGVNRPLKQPMFLGYRDNKALYGGGRLFILY